jgi:PAS domain S-box-containing protein
MTQMSRKIKNIPVVLTLGNQQNLLGTVIEEINNLPVSFFDCKSLKDVEAIDASEEVILFIIDNTAVKAEGEEAIRKITAIKFPEAKIIYIAQSDELLPKSLIVEDNFYVEVLYLPISPVKLKNRIISEFDLYERKVELSLALQELAINKKRLAADEQKIKILTNAVSEPIIFVDQNLTISFWNNEAEGFFGYTKFEVVNESFLRWLIAPNSHEKVKRLFADAKKSGAGILKRDQSFVVKNKLGVEVKVDVTLSYHKISDKDFNLVFVIHDTSRERRLEKEILKTRELKEENKLMREFLSHVNHELRTPMNAIMGISKTLVKYNSANLNPRQKEGLEIIYKSGELLLGLIKDLLEISKIEANKLSLSNEPFDFDRLLSQQKSQALNLIDNKNIRFVLKRSQAIPKIVIGDQQKLNQVLTNVIGNAVKYTEKGKIVLSSHIIDNKLYFEVSDTGVGIPKDQVNVIFEKFTRVKSNSSFIAGSGLGLHITKKLIELMHGDIKAESEANKGTVVRFYVTLSPDVKPIHPLPLQSEIEDDNVRILNYSPNRKLILVIDDSIQNTFIYSILSEQDDYSVMLCDTSKKGLSSAYEYMPDLIILKLEMPGVHGSSIIKELRRRELRMPVIAFSEFEKYKNPLPANTFLLENPISLESLFPVIQNQIIWGQKAYFFGAVVTEENPWFISKSTRKEKFIEITDQDEELAYLKICQLKIDYLVFEYFDKNSNGLGLFIKLINDGRIGEYKKIILQYEGQPLKYLADKIASYKNVVITTKAEMLKNNFFEE